MTSKKNFKKLVRERARKTGESYQEALRQLVLAAGKAEREANSVEFEQFRSDGSVHLIRIGRLTARGLPLATVLVAIEPRPPVTDRRN